MSHRLFVWAGFALFAASLAIYAFGATRLPQADARTDDMLRVLARAADIDTAAEEKLARAYWDRYPDVAKSDVYGVGGRLGILGAREHYMRHGRREGRVWGP